MELSENDSLPSFLLHLEQRFADYLQELLSRISEEEAYVYISLFEVPGLIMSIGKTPAGSERSTLEADISKELDSSDPFRATDRMTQRYVKLFKLKLEAIFSELDNLYDREKLQMRTMLHVPDWWESLLVAKVNHLKKFLKGECQRRLCSLENVARRVAKGCMASLTVDELNIPVGVLDVNGEVLFASNAVYSLMGVARSHGKDECTGKHLKVHMKPKDQERFMGAMRNISADPQQDAPEILQGLSFGPAGSDITVSIQLRKLDVDRILFIFSSDTGRNNAEQENFAAKQGETQSPIRVEVDFGEKLQEKCRIRDILCSIAAPVVVADASMVIEFMNQQGCEVFGYSLSEVVGKPVNMLMGPQDSESHDGYVANYRRGHSKIVGKKPRLVRGRDRNGRELTLYLTLTESNHKFTAVFTDVTKEYVSEHRLRNVVKASTVPIMSVSSEDMIFRKTNDAAIRLFGFAKDDLIGKPVSLIFGEDNSKKYRWDVWSGKRHDGYVVTKEEYGRRKCSRVVGRGPHLVEAKSVTGETLYLNVSATSTDGMYTLVCVDMTEAHLATERVKQILASIAAPVIVASSDMIIEYANEKAVEVFGYERVELLGEHVEILMPETEASQHQKHVDHVLNGGEPRIIGKRPRPVTALHKDGSPIKLLLTITKSGDRFTAVFSEQP